MTLELAVPAIEIAGDGDDNWGEDTDFERATDVAGWVVD
jgi:hypothetical protein